MVEVQFDAEVHKRIRLAAEEQHVSESFLISDVVLRWLEDREDYSAGMRALSQSSTRFHKMRWNAGPMWRVEYSDTAEDDLLRLSKLDRDRILRFFSGARFHSPGTEAFSRDSGWTAAWFVAIPCRGLPRDL